MKPDVALPRERALIAAYGMAIDAKLKDSSLSTPQRTGLTQLREARHDDRCGDPRALVRGD
ncbi:MAG TPA: hypothetical protein VK669_02860 [Candidatus Limnocylindrales bacterium]|nr:hypothetical protein [Candidatus Limnocylindrales bacterium]